MIARNLGMPDIKYIPFKEKAKNGVQTTKKALPVQIVDSLAQRNIVIDWFYRAQLNLRFSRSTLFLGIALLDKLLTLGMNLNQQNLELVAGTILLLATKFNEVYPVTVKKLNALSNDTFSTEKYVEIEGNVLSIVSFDLSPEDPIY